MYEDGNYKLEINWKNLIIKLAFIVIIILLFVWLFPMPKLDTFYNRVFNDNLREMKEVAENYFDDDKLPSSNGGSTTLKLQDMIDKKLIINFVDKNNNSCNANNSYAQVTKTENDTYVLKVQLSCDDKTDYVLENLNTAKATSQNNSNTTSTSHEVTQNNSEDDAEDIIDSNASYDKDGNKVEYQYKKAITKTSTSYTCPDGYAKENNICYKYATGETIPATPLYFNDTTETTNAKKNTNGGYTIKTIANKEIANEEKVCPSGYTLNGSICYKYDSVHVNPGSTNYTCPDGYAQNGNTCTKTIDRTYNSNSSTYYTCPDGYSLNGTTCYKNTTSSYSTTTCSCPSGYSESGNSCVKTISSPYTASNRSYWSNPTQSTSSRPLSVYNNGSSRRTLASHTCTSRGCKYIYNNYTLISSYYCPNGGSLSGSTCYRSSTSYANKVCTSTPHSSTSTSTISATPHTTSAGSYSCPSGYSMVGNSCVTTINANPSTSETTYTCPSGYIKNGNTCYQYTDATTKVTYKYTCPDGYTQTGENENTTCTKTVQSTSSYYCDDASATLVDDKCVKKVKGALKGYECPNGYILDNDKCVMKTTTCMPAKEVTNTSTTFEYKWSSSSSLDGWTQTGKTRNNTIQNSLNNDYEK
jgi:hypothetical protein